MLASITQSLLSATLVLASMSNGQMVALSTVMFVVVILLLVGIFTLIVDGADRAYWDRQGA